MALEQIDEIEVSSTRVTTPDRVNSDEAKAAINDPKKEVWKIEIIGGRVVLERGPFTRYITNTLHVSTGIVGMTLTSYYLFRGGSVAICEEKKDGDEVYGRRLSQGIEGYVEGTILRYVEIRPRRGLVRRMVDRVVSKLR